MFSLKVSKIELPSSESINDFRRRVISDMADIAEATFAKGAQRHSRLNGSGLLRTSLFRTDYANGSVRVGHDPTIAPHAQFVLHGSVPHVIRPKNAKMLRWFSPGGTPIFARFVNHPGYVGDNYLEEAAADALGGMAAIINARFNGI